MGRKDSVLPPKLPLKSDLFCRTIRGTIPRLSPHAPKADSRGHCPRLAPTAASLHTGYPFELSSLHGNIIKPFDEKSKSFLKKSDFISAKSPRKNYILRMEICGNALYSKMVILYKKIKNLNQNSLIFSRYCDIINKQIKNIALRRENGGYCL